VGGRARVEWHADVQKGYSTYVAVPSLGPHLEPASCPYRPKKTAGRGTKVPVRFAFFNRINDDAVCLTAVLSLLLWL
jgi:hypothetical protein